MLIQDRLPIESAKFIPVISNRAFNVLKEKNENSESKLIYARLTEIICPSKLKLAKRANCSGKNSSRNENLSLLKCDKTFSFIVFTHDSNFSKHLFQLFQHSDWTTKTEKHKQMALTAPITTNFDLSNCNPKPPQVRRFSSSRNKLFVTNWRLLTSTER